MSLAEQVVGLDPAGRRCRLHRLAVEPRIAAQAEGVANCATTISTAPSVAVCRMNFPSNFIVVPSMAASATLSASSAETGSG